MARMWGDVKETDLTVTDIEDLRNDESNNGFRGSFFDSDSTTAVTDQSEFYNLGDKMKARLCLGDPVKCHNQYLGVFPMPTSNIYGMCNNYSPAVFMESESNDCTQIVDLLTECTTTLNPLYHTDYLTVYFGKANSSVSKPVTVNSIYKLTKNSKNKDIFEYADLEAPLLTSVLDDISSEISCSNVLKEIAYTVNIEEKPAEDGVSKTAYFNILDISADVVVQDWSVVEEIDSVSGRAIASIHQSYSIKFVKKKEADEPV